ncbi:MAG: Rne/Rng family ribonuclease [Hyphomicrobiales bacterium]
MGSKMLIDATHAEETRVVVVRGNRIEEFDFESASRRQLKGNIYLAKVTRVEPSLQAAFVEYGGNRHGFLAFSEIHPDYYQIPLADRQALLREQEEEDEARQHDEDNNGNGDHSPDGEPEAAAQPLAAESAEPSLSEDVAAEPQEDEASGGGGLEAKLESAAAPERGIPGDMGSGIEVVDEDPESQKIEHVGAEDAMEEVPRRPRRQPQRTYKIQEVIKRRQVILVQVVKEERGNKGAALTTFLSLAGRYCVLMPNTARGGGISRKITDASDRRRLKEVARDVEVPKGMGLIVRTAGAQRTKTEIKRDYDYLIRLWESVRDLTLSSTAPALVYEEGSLIKRAIRDLYTKDVDEVFVEGEAAYREAKDFMKMLMPSHAKNVKLYKDTRPLFSRFQVETQLDALYSPTVTLPSGGYMVINQTEALVSVDINSGKATREHNIEDTALKTNLEASDEIARQLRLRDLAGLIVIDFIDMEEKRNNRAVERRVKEALKDDRARIQVGHISHFGLLEMSRQRLRPGLLEGSSRTCPHCEGRGIVRSISSCGLSVLRAIEEHLINRKAENLTVKANRETAFYILNDKRDHLLSIEQAYGISVFIVPSDEVKGSQAVIERAGERSLPARRIQAAPVKIDSAFKEDEEEAEAAADEPAGEEESEIAAEPPTERPALGERVERAGREDREDGGRRRRRGRRGGRRGREHDDERPRPEAAGEVPGLGDQPGVEADGEDRSEAPQPLEGEADGGAGAPAGAAEGGERVHEDRSRGRGRRRDRWGRDHDRSRDPRQPRDGREHRPREAHDAEVQAEAMAEPPAPAAAPAPRPAAIVVPEPAPAADEVQPRKWQPPAPTVTPAAVVRKAGWWSKR